MTMTIQDLKYCWADERPAELNPNGLWVNARECRQIATTSVGLCDKCYYLICGDGNG